MEKLTHEEFEKLWGKKPLIIIDTSSILDLYRHAPSKSENALNLLENIPKDQIFIPLQVYQEYNKNKQSVINEEYQKINNVKQNIDQSITKANNSIEKSLYEYKRRHYPAITELKNDINELMTSIKEKALEYKDSNQNEVSQNKLMLQNDKVEPFIRELKESGCIGDGFTITNLLEIYEEGERRFKYQIPPGYKDAKKDEKDNTKREKFGDLIVWKELLNKAKKVDKDIIYLSSDKKEWKSSENGIKSPDELLFNEFHEYSSHKLYFWELNDLVSMLSDYDKEDQLVRTVDLYKHEFLGEILKNIGKRYIIENDLMKILNYLIHSGELQDYVNNVLEDVEIVEYSTPEIIEFTQEIIDREAVFDGVFNVRLSLTITESYSKNYSSDLDVQVVLSGNFNIQIGIHPEEILKNESFDSWINIDGHDTKTGGYEILDYNEDDPYLDHRYLNDGCIHCGKRNAIYRTKSEEPVCDGCSVNYTACPPCGKLFKEPFFGNVCEDCQSSGYD